MTRDGSEVLGCGKPMPEAVLPFVDRALRQLEQFIENLGVNLRPRYSTVTDLAKLRG